MTTKERKFDGDTYDAAQDEARLESALERTVAVMRSGHWFSLERLAREVGCTEAGASARIRDLRKPRFAQKYGVKEVRSQRAEGSWWLYQVLFNEATA